MCVCVRERERLNRNLPEGHNRNHDLNSNLPTAQTDAYCIIQAH